MKKYFERFERVTYANELRCPPLCKKKFKNTETSGVYCMNPHKELIIHIKDTVIQYPYIVPVSSHIPTYVPSMIPNT